MISIFGNISTGVVLLLSLSLLASAQAISGPHAYLASPKSTQELFLADLLDELWFLYRDRVPFVKKCESILNQPIVNDHIAFRSFGGIHKISCLFEALGYEAKDCYDFPAKHLTAKHYEHRDNKDFPKLFISELKVSELDKEAQSIVIEALASHRPDLSLEVLAQLQENPNSDLIPIILDYLETLPWKKPTKGQVETLNKHSQYAAWVLVHGYRVNHFTALISEPDTLDAVYEQLKAAGLPMQDSIEGEVGSKLRQTSTVAAMSNVHVQGIDGGPAVIEWPYAYVEFAERNLIMTVDGNSERFEGFLGSQATKLFEMTKAQ